MAEQQTHRYPDLSPSELAGLADLLRRLLAALPSDPDSRADARIRARMAALAERLDSVREHTDGTYEPG